MRFLLPSLCLALLLAPAPVGAGPARRPPPGIRWEESVSGAVARAQREGRPLLVCVNALENERANIQLATEAYPSEAWGRATRAFVCLVGNPNDHAAKDGLCSRYGHAPCATHKDTLTWVMRRFAPTTGELISPQHVILEPDGAVAYRKEYFTGEERPALFETYLSMLAPGLAQRIAAIDREERITAMGQTPAAKAGDAARAWLSAPEDGLAVAGLLSALEEATEPTKRQALISAFAQAPFAQVAALVPTVEAATFAPDERPEETLAWVTALLAVDRPTGAWAAARALVRSRAKPLRTQLLGAWSAPADDPGERAAREEALRLAGLPVAAGGAADDAAGLDRVPLLRRQRAREGMRTGGPALPKDLASLAPGALRRALLAAPPESVTREAATVEVLLTRSPYARVRVAAALALLGARRPAAGRTAQVLLEAVFDPLEGPEARALASARLGEDPGEDADAWAAALTKVLGGGR